MSKCTLCNGAGWVTSGGTTAYLLSGLEDTCPSCAGTGFTEMISVPRKRLASLVEWIQNEQDNLSCSDLCDKTFEFQGCPSGTCALEDGKAEIRWWLEQLGDDPYETKNT